MAQSSAVPFAVIIPTVYGQMIVNRHDIRQTNALFKTGHALDHNEIVLLVQIIQAMGKDPIVLDVGANFGAHSLALARNVGPEGKVHAFEPQRLIYNLLVGSIALNSLTNIYCHNVALGDREGQVEIPQYDYNQPMNFASIEFTPEQAEPLHQARGRDPTKAEHVRLTTIDHFDFPKVQLMKIDAEGMEMQILQGAMQTIRRCRPVIFIEVIKSDYEALRQAILQLDYAVYLCGINFLCLPSEISGRIHVKNLMPAPPRVSGEFQQSSH